MPPDDPPDDEQALASSVRARTVQARLQLERVLMLLRPALAFAVALAVLASAALASAALASAPLVWASLAAAAHEE